VMVCVSNPINENAREEPSGTVRLYLPSRSVAVPVVVPGTETVTPGMGWPSVSVTVPWTVKSMEFASRSGGAADTWLGLKPSMYSKHIPIINFESPYRAVGRVFFIVIDSCLSFFKETNHPQQFLPCC